MSPATIPEAPHIHVDIVSTTIPEGFGEGSYDTSLLSLYAEQDVRHAWDKEVKFICIYYFEIHLL